ncbi:MAG TPA: hypothetical protein VFB83_02815 [Propionibacteriaceae bacterium]|nr:hypothetical protein [Propionibacteriaceae bacterium]
MNIGSPTSARREGRAAEINGDRPAGIIGGGILGALHHKGLGLDKADRDRIAAELGDGKAAVGVLAPADEALAVMVGLTASGGAGESHEVADEDLEEAHAAAATDRLLADRKT